MESEGSLMMNLPEIDLIAIETDKLTYLSEQIRLLRAKVIVQRNYDARNDLSRIYDETLKLIGDNSAIGT